MKKSYELNLYNKTLYNPRISDSRLISPNVRDILFNGLLIERCSIKTLASSNIKAYNVIVGPHTTIEWSLLNNIKIKSAHATFSSTLKHNFFTTNEFHNGTYRNTNFKGNVFFNTVFIRGKFTATVFKDCYFSGCMFYNCSFSHNDDKGPFINCNFKPNTVYGKFSDQAKTWPMLANKEVKTNHFVNEDNNIKMTNCSGIKNISSNCQQNINTWRVELGSLIKSANIGGYKAIKYAFNNWWAAKTPKTTVPQKNQLQAYRFTTTGV